MKKNQAGQSPTWIRALRQVVEIARFTDASILIMGESGTGKELVARLIHTLDLRPNKRDLGQWRSTAVPSDRRSCARMCPSAGRRHEVGRR